MMHCPSDGLTPDSHPKRSSTCFSLVVAMLPPALPHVFSSVPQNFTKPSNTLFWKTNGHRMWLFYGFFWLYCVALQRGRQEQQDINKDGKTRAVLDYRFLDLATFQNWSHHKTSGKTSELVECCYLLTPVPCSDIATAMSWADVSPRLTHRALVVTADCIMHANNLNLFIAFL